MTRWIVVEKTTQAPRVYTGKGFSSKPTRAKVFEAEEPSTYPQMDSVSLASNVHPGQSSDSLDSLILKEGESLDVAVARYTAELRELYRM